VKAQPSETNGILVYDPYAVLMLEDGMDLNLALGPPRFGRVHFGVVGNGPIVLPTDTTETVWRQLVSRIQQPPSRTHHLVSCPRGTPSGVLAVCEVRR